MWVLNRKNDRIEYLLLKGRGLFMAKSLASLKQRDDYQGRQIHLKHYQEKDRRRHKARRNSRRNRKAQSAYAGGERSAGF